MAHRRQTRRIVERGWTVNSDIIEVTHTDVDNVVTVLSDPIIAFDDLVDLVETTQLTEQDDFADYYVEAIKGAYDVVGDLATGNATGGLPFSWGIIVGDLQTFADLPNSLAPGLTTEPFYSEAWRGFSGLRQVMQVHFDVAVAGTGTPFASRAAVNENRWFNDFQTGQIHLRRGEAVFLAVSQTGAGGGVGTSFGQTWIGDDSLVFGYQTSVLVRKKRGA